MKHFYKAAVCPLCGNAVAARAVNPKTKKIEFLRSEEDGSEVWEGAFAQFAKEGFVIEVKGGGVTVQGCQCEKDLIKKRKSATGGG